MLKEGRCGTVGFPCIVLLFLPVSGYSQTLHIYFVWVMRVHRLEVKSRSTSTRGFQHLTEAATVKISGKTEWMNDGRKKGREENMSMKIFFWAARVAQQFTATFSPGHDPGAPGSSPTSGSLHGGCFSSLCLCLCFSLSLCVSHE